MNSWTLISRTHSTCQMTIPIDTPDKVVLVKGTGSGKTKLTAFDDALHDAGIHNANIIQVSSVIPQDADLITDYDRNDIMDSINTGGLHPMVVAKSIARRDEVPKDSALHAAIGAGLFDSGYGVNVETDNIGIGRETIKINCKDMLEELANTRDESLVSKKTVISSQDNHDSEALASIAAAVYL